MRKRVAKISVITTLWVLVFLGGCQKQNDTVGFYIESTLLTPDTVRIDYEIVNQSRECIWACQDVDIYFPFGEICEIEDSTLYVYRKLSAIPEYVEFSEAMIANYVRLKPTDTIKGSVDILVPDRFESFSEYERPPTFSGIERISFEVGYLDRALAKSYLDLRHVTDPNDPYYEQGESIRQRYGNSASPDNLFISHVWYGIRNEKICHAIMTLNTEGEWTPRVAQ